MGWLRPLPSRQRKEQQQLLLLQCIRLGQTLPLLLAQCQMPPVKLQRQARRDRQQGREQQQAAQPLLHSATS